METFAPPEDWNPEDHVRDAFGIIQGDPQEVVAVFDAQAAPYVRERTWHPSQQLESLPDGSLRCRFRVGIEPEIESWLLGFGGSVAVEAPDELVERLRNHHERALKKLS